MIFTPDGRHLVTANGNGTSYILRLPDVADKPNEPVTMSPTTDAAQASSGSTANKPSPTAASPDSESPIRRHVVGSLRGTDGNWKLPPGAPRPAIAPFDENKAKEHQRRWAEYLKVPVEITNSIGMKLILIPPWRVHDGLTQGTDRRGIEGTL